MTLFLKEACHDKAKLLLEPFGTGSRHRIFRSVDGRITPLIAIEYRTVHWTFGSVDGGITPLITIEYRTVHDRITSIGLFKEVQSWLLLLGSLGEKEDHDDQLVIFL